MTFITDILTPNELKNRYRTLAKTFHPDKEGGDTELMQRINEEYSIWQEGFNTFPANLDELRIGHTVYVNGSKCIVIEITDKLFKAKSLETLRESYFDKTTGYGLFNLRIRAYINFDLLDSIN